MWTAIFALEMLITLMGNAIAIAVFWKQRSTLKRTCYLLINLTVADLLVGIGEIVHFFNNIFFYVKNSKSAMWENIVLLPDAFAGSASLFFLTVISVEWLYAIAQLDDSYPVLSVCVRFLFGCCFMFVLSNMEVQKK